MGNFFVVVMAGLALFSLFVTGYGIMLAFKASLVLGVLVLLVEPTPAILGILALFGYPQVAELIARWLGL